MKRTIIAIIMAIAMTVAFVPAGAFAKDALPEITFVFSNDAVTAYVGEEAVASTDESISPSMSGDTFELVSKDGFTVNIKDKGTYTFTGECDNGNIFMKDAGEKDLTLKFEDLMLTEPDNGSCPLQTKGDTKFTLNISGDNVLSDANHNGESPKACINVKKKIELTGDSGSLTVNGNNKNGIKSDTSIEVKGKFDLNVDAVDNGISADKELKFTKTREGLTTVRTETGKCLVSNPDELEPDSSEDLNGLITINGGKFDLEAANNDAISSERTVTISDTNNSLEAKIIAKEDAINASNDNVVNVVEISGGNIYAYGDDDGIDSNGDLVIKGGTIEAYGGPGLCTALDAGDDNNVIITGGTVFAAGSADELHLPQAGGQPYKAIKRNRNIGETVKINDNGTDVEYTLPRSIEHIIYSSPTVTGPDTTIKEVALAKSEYGYTGKNITPSIAAVYDADGNSVSDYQAEAPYKNVGPAKVTVTAKSGTEYTGSVSVDCKIVPKAIGISKLTKGKKKLTVKWKVPAATYRNQMSGIEIWCSTSSNFATHKTVKASKTAKSKTIKKLAKKKTYYVKMRAYRTIDGVIYNSTWSGVKKIKTR